LTVISVFQAVQRPERGWDDPGYPLGVWIAAGNVTGNVSGGIRAVQINLATAGTPVGLAFSLEQLLVRDSETNNKVLDTFIANLEPVYVSAGGSRRFSADLIQASGSIEVALRIADMRSLAYFLGIAASAASVASLTFQVANANNEVLTVNATGYIWGARSVIQRPGGYRRPPDGMFSV